MTTTAVTTRVDDPRLAPAGRDQMAEVLRRLWAGLPLRGGDEPKLVLVAYLAALDGYPLWAIEQAVQHFLRGEVAGQSDKFCPRPPELVAAVRAVLRPLHDEAMTGRDRERADKAQREKWAWHAIRDATSRDLVDEGGAVELLAFLEREGRHPVGSERAAIRREMDDNERLRREAEAAMAGDRGPLGPALRLMFEAMTARRARIDRWARGDGG